MGNGTNGIAKPNIFQIQWKYSSDNDWDAINHILRELNCFSVFKQDGPNIGAIQC